MKRTRRRPWVGALTGAGLALALALSAGCQSYVFEPVVAALISVNNTTYELEPISAADILFVVDDSCSMAGEQQNLADNFDVFINAIEAENADRKARGEPLFEYRLAVASTSISIRYEGAGGNVEDRTTYRITDPSACQTSYPLSQGDPYPVGRFMAAPGNQAIIDTTKEPFRSDRAQIIQQFKQNVRLGVCGSGQEQGLLAMQWVLEQNPDFVRPDAKLVVVFLSDEEDCSDPDRDLLLSTARDRCVEEAGAADGGLLGPVADYAGFLGRVSSNVVVGSIVSANGTPPDVVAGVCRDQSCEQQCPYPNPSGDPCYCGGQSAGSRYLKLADLVANGSLKDSICQSSFSDTMRALAKVVTTVDVIYLKARPFDDDPSLMLLKIIRDGDEILCNSPSASMQDDPSQSCAQDQNLDWEYDADEVAIRLCDHDGSSCKIQPGDQYKVSFVERACSADNPC